MKGETHGSAGSLLVTLIWEAPSSPWCMVDDPIMIIPKETVIEMRRVASCKVLFVHSLQLSWK